VVEYDIDVIKKASKLRARHTSKNLSMTDCIGYIYAKENGLMFVTGDREFKGVENVEFVQ
jgi:predicted nucleic acid-binding protein